LHKTSTNDLPAPVTLITGGSDGIGRAIAEQFAQQGNSLYLVARNLDRLQKAADELTKKWHIPVYIASVDLFEKESSRTLLHQIKQQNLYVDNLINSAAIALMRAFDTSDATDIKSLIQLNITTTTELMHLCLNDMHKRGSGGILNISSLSGLLPMPNLALYSASKGYLIALTRALSEEMRGSGVKVSVLVPGPVDTKFIEHGSTGIQKFAPMLTAESAARVAFEGYMAGQTVITPGFLGAFYRLGTKFLPHKFLLRTLSPFLKKLYG